jgi:hypothetical protein
MRKTLHKLFLCSGHFQDTLLLSVAEDQARMNTRWPLRRRNWRIGFPDALSRRALCPVGGKYKHCHSAILVYLYYTRNAELEPKTYAASLIFRRKVRFLVIQGAVMLGPTFGGPADPAFRAGYATPTMAVRAHGNEGPAPLPNHASHFRFVRLELPHLRKLKFCGWDGIKF